MTQATRIITIAQDSKESQFGHLSIQTPDCSQVVSVVYGYRRCHDFDEKNQPGQDCIRLAYGDEYIVGVVADGVGQSFYGDIAAVQVADWLIENLWVHRENPWDYQQLEEGLKNLESTVHAVIQDHKLPEYLPAIQVKALEKTRTKGSQTVFSAFIFNIECKRVTLYQVGDITAQVYYWKPGSSEAEIQTLPSDAKGRWSTAGKSSYCMGFHQVPAEGIMVKSDGASEDWGGCLDEGSLSLQSFQEMAEEYAGKDDVSFVCLFMKEGLAPLDSENYSSDGEESTPEETVADPSLVTPAETGNIAENPDVNTLNPEQKISGTNPQDSSPDNPSPCANSMGSKTLPEQGTLSQIEEA
jgi:hypothetical protein